jgi:hypothetical protein
MPHRFAEEDEVYEIELEFLGKDSMLFKQTIDFSSYGTNGVKVYRNLEDFTKKKKPAEDVFETLSVRSACDREELLMNSSHTLLNSDVPMLTCLLFSFPVKLADGAERAPEQPHAGAVGQGLPYLQRLGDAAERAAQARGPAWHDRRRQGKETNATSLDFSWQRGG